jgi:hypothetical protein
MRTLATKKEVTIPKKLGLSAAEQALLMRVNAVVFEPETCELNTGKYLAMAQAVLTVYRGGWLSYLKGLPFTYRTAYRRINVYERAMKIWPKEVVESAIEHRLKIVGYTETKPMGLFEDMAPPKDLTPQGIEDYLMQAEITARQKAPGGIDIDAYDRLKKCFRLIEKCSRGLGDKERRDFLKDLVGVEITLLTPEFADSAPAFKATEIPSDFWKTTIGGYTRTTSTRRRSSKGAKDAWGDR